MFTGIIEEIGAVQAIKQGANSSVLTITGTKIFDDLKLGDSVAVNGVCLTVSTLSGNSFSADVMHETLSRSSLGQLKQGAKVNMERAMPANGRFGGHIVSGHIDGLGTILQIKRDDNAIWYTIRAPREILRYIVAKGSIAIDGISLTVASLTETDFAVSIIPHTAQETVLSLRRVGDTVNLENDIFGKYVERFLTQPPPAASNSTSPSSAITAEYLINNGF
ncbi:MAG TPA: riboflavin synthase [Coriobacteriia bacterium]|nr:riboflavin synthase [Coriobacteriia bacterium]